MSLVGSATPSHPDSFRLRGWIEIGGESLYPDPRSEWAAAKNQDSNSLFGSTTAGGRSPRAAAFEQAGPGELRRTVVVAIQNERNSAAGCGAPASAPQAPPRAASG